MLIDPKSIRHYRLCAHHLDKKIPPESILEAAGACGLQNSPPGAWETALFNRLEGCPLQELRESLYARKILLQAWSYRGVPVVFPTDESSVFLSSLIARQGEEPWIYTRGITAALDFLGMPLDALLPLVRKAAAALDNQVVKSKESLDRMLAEIVRRDLPPEKKALWDAPSLYGSPDRQTMGGAVVSFLLRPCSFYSLVVFGERQADSPTFTSFRNWTGHEPVLAAGGGKGAGPEISALLRPRHPVLLRELARSLPAAGRQTLGRRRGGNGAHPDGERNRLHTVGGQRTPPVGSRLRRTVDFVGRP